MWLLCGQNVFQLVGQAPISGKEWAVRSDELRLNLAEKPASLQGESLWVTWKSQGEVLNYRVVWGKFSVGDILSVIEKEHGGDSTG